MNIDRLKLFAMMLLGATLSSLFFYPLFSELHDNILILQWRLINTVELFCAFLLFSLFAGVAFYLIYKCRNFYIKLLILLLIVFIPFMSFFIYVLKQLLGAGIIVTVSNLLFVRHSLILLRIIAILVVGVVFIRYPRRIVQIVILILFVLSPITILSIWSGIKASSKNTIIFMNNCNDKKLSLSQHKPEDNILIILFDELSYDYLYENGEIKREYENFRNLSQISDNYHRALSPGDCSLTSIPGLIMGKTFKGIKMEYGQIYKITKKQETKLLTIDSKNLFSYAKEAGYKTFCFGAYLHYCVLFGEWLDEGRSFSVYNYGNLSNEFKPYNPIFTTIVLLPHQFPYGLLKNPLYSLWEKNIIEQSFALTMGAINSPEPFFIFTHFYIPHLPFTFNKNGFYKNSRPFLQNQENYSKQLDYVDKLLGNLIAELKRNGKFDNTTIVVLADHNYRIMFPERKMAVPLIIKHRDQRTHNDIYDSVRTSVVLGKELFGLNLDENR